MGPPWGRFSDQRANRAFRWVGLANSLTAPRPCQGTCADEFSRPGLYLEPMNTHDRPPTARAVPTDFSAGQETNRPTSRDKRVGCRQSVFHGTSIPQRSNADAQAMDRQTEGSEGVLTWRPCWTREVSSRSGFGLLDDISGKALYVVIPEIRYSRTRYMGIHGLWLV